MLLHTVFIKMPYILFQNYPQFFLLLVNNYSHNYSCIIDTCLQLIKGDENETLINKVI